MSTKAKPARRVRKKTALDHAFDQADHDVYEVAAKHRPRDFIGEAFAASEKRFGEVEVTLHCRGQVEENVLCKSLDRARQVVVEYQEKHQMRVRDVVGHHGRVWKGDLAVALVQLDGSIKFEEKSYSHEAKKTVEDKIREGHYESKLPVSEPPKVCRGLWVRDEIVAERRQQDQARLDAEFKRDALLELGISDHPKRERAFQMVLWMTSTMAGPDKQDLYDNLSDVAYLMKP